MGSLISGFFWSDRLALSIEARDELTFGSITLFSLMGVLFGSLLV